MKKVLLFVFGSWLFWAGCYTVVKHPDLIEAENPQFSHQIYLTDDCQSCHGTQNPAFANSMNSESSPRLNYIYRNERWNYFYQSPWWERSMFGSGQLNSGNQAVDNSLPTSSSRSRFPGAGSSNSTGGNTNTRIYQGGSSGNSGLMRSSSNSTSDSKSEANATRKPADKKESRKAIRGSGEKKSEKTSDSRKRDQK